LQAPMDEYKVNNPASNYSGVGLHTQSRANAWVHVSLGRVAGRDAGSESK
jgi:hypothetical protein